MDLLPIFQTIAPPALTAIVVGLIQNNFLRKRHKEEIQRLRNEYNTLRDSVTWYTNRDFVLLLDGPKESGKTALVSKWIDPTVHLDKVKLMETMGLVQVGPVHVCSNFYVDENDHTKCEDRYRLHIMDVGGEHSNKLLDVVTEWGVHACILVVDPKNEKGSFSRFSPHTLKTMYCSSTVHKSCRGILVYISKTDLCEDEEVQRIEDRIRREILPHLTSLYPNNLQVVSGSALTGYNLHAALGHVASWLGLSEYFCKHVNVKRAE
jgi:hypothetical protein